MRLAIISTYPPQKCGVGVYTRNLTNAMSKLVETEVISFSGYKYEYKRVKPMIKGALSYFKIVDYIQKKNFDKVIIQYDYTCYNLFVFPLFLLLLKIYGLKTNLVMHTVASYKDSIKKNLFRLYHTYLLLFTDSVFVHTQNAKNRLLTNTFIKKQVEIVAHPILVRNTKPKIYTKGELKLLCFGFIVWDKGIDIAIKAFGGMKNISLKIVGSVHPRAMKKQYDFLEHIRTLAARYKNVGLINRFVSEEEKAKLYTKSNFIVMPYRSIEQSGVIAEAWSFQRIPLCSDIKPLKEDTKNGKYGVLFKADDAADLRNKTLSLANDLDKQKKILINIKKIIKERDFDKLSKEFLKKMK